MILKLDSEEIKKALAKCLEEKTSFIHGAINPDDCSFEIIDEDGDRVAYSEIFFEVEV